MLVANLPMSRGIWVVRHPFEHHCGGAVGERTIEYIAVSRDPSYVCCAPINITFVIVEDILVRHRGIDHISTGAMHYTFGLACGARSIKYKEGVLGVHLFRGAICRLIRH